MRRSLWLLPFLFITVVTHSQTGKYFTISDAKCKNSKVYIDYRIQQYAGEGFSIEWTGGCKNGFAEGTGKLIIKGKKTNRTFTLTYEGNLVQGKKEGNGRQLLYAYDFQLNPDNNFPWVDPYYLYKGSFKNDEFNGFGEFRASYPYPIDPDNVGKGISMEALELGSPIWRSDLFFYEYQGNFVAGRIGDTEHAIGRTKRMRWLSELIEYKGPVKNGKPNGKGTAIEVTIKAMMQGQSWRSATGNFVNGSLEGYGKEVREWSEYEGEFVNSQWEGEGTLTSYKHDNKSEDGRSKISVMKANFKDNLANGFCTIYYQNSAAYKYTGPIKDSELDGTGEIEFLDGSKLRGNFRKGNLEGEGSITFANGERFVGIYANSKPVRGTFYHNNGAKYVGQVTVREEKDKITGKPINIYIREGKGTYTDKDGASYDVECTNDKCTRMN